MKLDIHESSEQPKYCQLLQISQICMSAWQAKSQYGQKGPTRGIPINSSDDFNCFPMKKMNLQCKPVQIASSLTLRTATWVWERRCIILGENTARNLRQRESMLLSLESWWNYKCDLTQNNVQQFLNGGPRTIASPQVALYTFIKKKLFISTWTLISCSGFFSSCAI